MTSHVKKRRWLRRTFLILGALAILLVLDAAWVGTTARHGLEAAREHIRTGADAVVDGRVDDAAWEFEQARAAADRARQLSWHPAGFIAGTLPWIGDDVHAVDDLAQAASLTARAGETIATAAQRVNWDGSGIPGVSSGSGISTEVLSRIAPEVRAADEDLTQAVAVLDAVPTSGLLPPVEDAVVTARGELAGRADLLSSAADVAELVPSLMSEGQRYLLVIQNPGEIRGTGGFMGFFGELDSDGEHLQLTKLFSTGDLPKVRPVEASEDFKRRYARFQSLIDMRQANFSPDLPSSSGVITQIANELGWGSFDGVFMVDTIWMQYMLEATGPITAPGWDEPITTDNVVDVLGYQLPALPSERSNVIQGNIGRAVWGALQEGALSPSAFATALARSVNERHMQLWFVDPDQERLAQDLGAAGDATLGKNPLYVVWQGLAASKVAIFARRDVTVDVTLDADGTATVVTTLRVVNRAPDTPPSDLLGNGEDFPVGTFAGYPSVYLPVALDGDPTFASSGPTATGVEQEFGHPVAFGFMGVASGQEMTWSVTYRAAEAVTQVGAGMVEYRMDFLPQPTFAPGLVSVTFHLPPGTEVAERSPGVDDDGETPRYVDRPAVPTAIWIRYADPSAG